MADMTEDPVTYRLFNEIGIIDQLAGAAFRQVLPAPLNQSMFGVLNHFVRLGDGKTPTDLARIFQVAKPSMTATLGKLERAGFVRIDPDAQDGRTKRVFLTPQGREARAAAIAATQSLFDGLASELADFDIPRLVEELGRLRAILDAARD